MADVQSGLLKMLQNDISPTYDMAYNTIPTQYSAGNQILQVILSSLGFIPILYTVCMSLTCILAVLFSIYFKQVKTYTPILCNAGANIPSYYVFAPGLAFSASLLLLCVVLSSLRVYYMGQLIDALSPKVLSIIGLVFGVLASIGLALMGAINFNLFPTFHNISAYLFIFACISFQIMHSFGVLTLRNALKSANHQPVRIDVAFLGDDLQIALQFTCTAVSIIFAIGIVILWRIELQRLAVNSKLKKAAREIEADRRKVELEKKKSRRVSQISIRSSHSVDAESVYDSTVDLEQIEVKSPETLELQSIERTSITIQSSSSIELMESQPLNLVSPTSSSVDHPRVPEQEISTVLGSTALMTTNTMSTPTYQPKKLEPSMRKLLISTCANDPRTPFPFENPSEASLCGPQYEVSQVPSSSPVMSLSRSSHFTVEMEIQEQPQFTRRFLCGIFFIHPKLRWHLQIWGSFQYISLIASLLFFLTLISDFDNFILGARIF